MALWINFNCVLSIFDSFGWQGCRSLGYTDFSGCKAPCITLPLNLGESRSASSKGDFVLKTYFLRNSKDEFGDGGRMSGIRQQLISNKIYSENCFEISFFAITIAAWS